MDPPEIDYAPPLPLHRRRRTRRIIGATTLFVFLLSSGLFFGPAAWRRTQLLYWQRQSLKYVAPPDQIVADNDPAIASKLLRQSHDFVGLRADRIAVRPVQSSKRFFDLLSPPGRRDSATLFLHERRSAKGNVRLVVIESWPCGAAGVKASLGMLPTVVKVGSSLHPPIIIPQFSAFFLPSGLRAGRHECWFAGQIDATDESHFTIRCKADGAEHLFDGWLRDDDRVELEMRAATSPAPSSPE